MSSRRVKTIPPPKQGAARFTYTVQDGKCKIEFRFCKLEFPLMRKVKLQVYTILLRKLPELLVNLMSGPCSLTEFKFYKGLISNVDPEIIENCFERLLDGLEVVKEKAYELGGVETQRLTDEQNRIVHLTKGSVEKFSNYIEACHLIVNEYCHWLFVFYLGSELAGYKETYGKPPPTECHVFGNACYNVVKTVLGERLEAKWKNVEFIIQKKTYTVSLIHESEMKNKSNK